MITNISDGFFLMYGVQADKDKLKEALKNNYKSHGLIEEIKNFDKIWDEDFGSILENIMCKAGLSYYYDAPNDDICIGLSWDTVKDNETGIDFKNRCNTLIKNVYPKAYAFSTLASIVE